MTTYGYIRTSRQRIQGTSGSDPASQAHQLHQDGVPEANIHRDVGISGGTGTNSREASSFDTRCVMTSHPLRLTDPGDWSLIIHGQPWVTHRGMKPNFGRFADLGQYAAGLEGAGVHNRGAPEGKAHFENISCKGFLFLVLQPQIISGRFRNARAH